MHVLDSMLVENNSYLQLFQESEGNPSGSVTVISPKSSRSQTQFYRLLR